MLLIGGAIGVLALLLPGFALFFGAERLGAFRTVFFTGCGAVFVVAFIEWLLLGEDPTVGLFQAAVAVAAASVLLSAGPPPVWRAIVLVAVWSTLVVVPVGFSVFDVEHGVLSVRIGTLDFAGALALAVCTGAAGLAIALVQRWRGQVPAIATDGRRWPVFAYSLVAVLGLAVVQVASELVIDDTTTAVLIVSVLATVSGAVGWVVTLVVSGHQLPLAEVGAGAIAGSVSVLPFAPWLDLPAAVVLGLAAGILGAIARTRAQKARLGAWARIVGVLLVPGTLGVVAAGVIANPSGLIYSGHTDLLVSQLAGIAVSALVSFAVAGTLAFILVPRRGLD
jgi:ammonium transporter, Amt family